MCIHTFLYVKTRILLTKSADALLGTAMLRGMGVGLNYSTGEVVIEEIKAGEER